MVMLDFIRMGSAELWRTENTRKIQNENIYIRGESNQRSLGFIIRAHSKNKEGQQSCFTRVTYGYIIWTTQLPYCLTICKLFHLIITIWAASPKKCPKRSYDVIERCHNIFAVKKSTRACLKMIYGLKSVWRRANALELYKSLRVSIW